MKFFILIILIFNGYSLFFSTLKNYLYLNSTHTIQCAKYNYISIIGMSLQSCKLRYDIEKQQYYLSFVLDSDISVNLVFQKDPDDKFTIQESESSKNISKYFNVEFPIYFFSPDNDRINLIIKP